MAAPDITVAVAIFAHRNPEQLALLVGALQHPALRLYLHLDAKVEAAPFRAALTGTGAKVTWLKRQSSHWGGIGLVDAELDALRCSVADGCDYFVLISGQDFPIRSVNEIVSFYAENHDRSFVDHTPLPSDRYPLGGRERTEFYTYTILGRRETYFPPGSLPAPLSYRGRILNAALRVLSLPRPERRFPDYLKPFAGEMWVNLSRDAVMFILDFVSAHPDYRRYHTHTLIPDELFVPSILLGSSFADHHEVVNDDLRYIRWPEPRGSHPDVLTLDDAPNLRASKDMFARKLTLRDSAALIAELTKPTDEV